MNTTTLKGINVALLSVTILSISYVLLFYLQYLEFFYYYQQGQPNKIFHRNSSDNGNTTYSEICIFPPHQILGKNHNNRYNDYIAFNGSVRFLGFYKCLRESGKIS